MPELLWCALSGLLAGALVSAPVWIWAMARERHRAQEYRRLARQAWLTAHPEDDA
jgi:hypothetical protein